MMVTLIVFHLYDDMLTSIDRIPYINVSNIVVSIVGVYWTNFKLFIIISAH